MANHLSRCTERAGEKQFSKCYIPKGSARQMQPGKRDACPGWRWQSSADHRGREGQAPRPGCVGHGGRGLPRRGEGCCGFLEPGGNLI